MPATHPPEVVAAFEGFIAAGYTQTAAYRKAGVSSTWAKRHMKRMALGDDGKNYARVAARRRYEVAKTLGRALNKDELCPEALRALEDFDYFRQRYFGHLSTGWQIEAAKSTVEWLASEEREFAVFNEPPGTGKSTFTVDLMGWLIVRDRALRAVFGSYAANNAARQAARLRRALERATPVMANPRDIDQGKACNAESTLAADYGLFRPITQTDKWRGDEFVVVQADGSAIDEKEPTVSAVGRDTGFLGNRYDFIVWDDVVVGKALINIETIEKDRLWWDTEAESRLEPGGLMMLVGQRMASNDLFRYCLDKVGDDEDEDSEDRQYHHVKYQAHNEDLCTGKHEIGDPGWPDGCLLDPKRVSWRELVRLRRNQPQTYAIQYQQEDADPETALVHPLWLSGGTDPETGERFIGCYDDDRGIGQRPDLPGSHHYFITIDPSPTKYWAIQCWDYTPTQNFLNLIDCFRSKADVNEVLGFNPNTGLVSGVIAEWCEVYPITAMVFEFNAAQRWFVLEDWRKQWAQSKGIRIIEHTTGVRKADETLGIRGIAPWYQNGQIRLPGKDLVAKKAVAPLVNELTRWPNAGTDDQVMANWFAIFKLRSVVPLERQRKAQPRPSWLASLPDLKVRAG